MIANDSTKEPTESNTEDEDDEGEFPITFLWIPLTLAPFVFCLWIDDIELRQEPRESPKDLVYRHLENVVACSYALNQLLQPDVVKIFKAISANVVLVTGFSTDVMSTDDVLSGLLERYPRSKDIFQTTKPYLESNVPTFFHGAIHPEATLMGLISYFKPDHKHN